jgi:hypothetical protein
VTPSGRRKHWLPELPDPMEQHQGARIGVTPHLSSIDAGKTAHEREVRSRLLGSNRPSRSNHRMNRARIPRGTTLSSRHLAGVQSVCDRCIRLVLARSRRMRFRTDSGSVGGLPNHATAAGLPPAIAVNRRPRQCTTMARATGRRPRSRPQPARASKRESDGHRRISATPALRGPLSQRARGRHQR